MRLTSTESNRWPYALYASRNIRHWKRQGFETAMWGCVRPSKHSDDLFGFSTFEDITGAGTANEGGLVMPESGKGLLVESGGQIGDDMKLGTLT